MSKNVKDLAKKNTDEICRDCRRICYLVNTAGLVWRCPYFDLEHS